MDNNLQDMIAKAVVDIIKQKEDNKGIKVGVSARHVHLSRVFVYLVLSENNHKLKFQEQIPLN